MRSTHDEERIVLRVGFIGWRGMVGSVLMDRMRENKDFDGIESTFFSTSDVGGKGPEISGRKYDLHDAHDTKKLAQYDVLISCQGGAYTSDVIGKLRSEGYQGYFIDAASTLRMASDSVLILDPVNLAVIKQGLKDGVKTYVGPNCTVSLMLLGMHGLFKAGLVEWVTSMTYQAASGAGASNMRELIVQMGAVADSARALLDNPSTTALALDTRVSETLRSAAFPKENFGVPLAGSLIPWIDKPVENGQTKEEWKAFAEANKILGSKQPIPIDGICVRVGAMRCHSQGVTVKLNRDVPLPAIEGLIAEANEWVKLVPNQREATERSLSPAAVSGTLDIPVGRVHKLNLGPTYLGAFTVGDQLLWGAAEPLRRMLRILREHLGQ
jgi:aspartate-semialdehyde dehydrogenase